MLRVSSRSTHSLPAYHHADASSSKIACAGQVHSYGRFLRQTVSKIAEGKKIRGSQSD